LGYFKDIKLNNFRNFENFFLEFKNGCNIILGKNGSGKTNILESLSFLKPLPFSNKDKLSNIFVFPEPFFPKIILHPFLNSSF
jgi:recombinational DNA repair ATPase RecF